jgi:serine/threonine protein kinase
VEPSLAQKVASDAPPDGGGEATLPRGAVLGRYIVVEPIGRGGMGVVYRAYDPELDRRVALKLLRRQGESTGDEQARLVREGKAMARLAHPNVAAVHDVGVDDDQVFIAMELVEGQTLRAWLETPRSWRAIVAMFLQAGRGLSAAHAAGMVHRDFKPDNVIVGADGRARVVDFGLARTHDATCRPSSSPAGASDPRPISSRSP